MRLTLFVNTNLIEVQETQQTNTTPHRSITGCVLELSSLRMRVATQLIDAPICFGASLCLPNIAPRPLERMLWPEGPPVEADALRKTGTRNAGRTPGEDEGGERDASGLMYETQIVDSIVNAAILNVSRRALDEKR